MFCMGESYMTFQEILLDAFRKNKEKIAMIYKDNSFTYKDIYVKTCQLVKEIEGNCLEKKYVAIYCKELKLPTPKRCVEP